VRDGVVFYVFVRSMHQHAAFICYLILRLYAMLDTELDRRKPAVSPPSTHHPLCPNPAQVDEHECADDARSDVA
jgi:hypothetical protein